MDHGPPLLAAILVFLVAGIAGIGVAKTLRLSPILGFFVAGALVGPHGFGVLPESDEVHLLAELGVAFLLFDIGTHLSFRKIWQQRADLFGFGSLQVVTTAALAGSAAWIAGLPPTAAFVVGCGLALSSTAVVLQVSKDRGEQGGPLGQKAVAVLIFQDLFVVLLLVVVPALAGDGERSLALEIVLAVGKVGLAFVIVSLIGRFLLQPAFRWIARQRSEELFTFAALTFVLAVAFGAGQLGLSLPLGAFLAGLTLAESRFSPVVQSELTPFRGLLMSLFFVSVGMGLEIEAFVERPLALVAVTLALIAGKALVIVGLGRATRLGTGFSVRLGALLAQGSEFAFVLFGAAVGLGLLADGAAGLLGASIGVTLALTPFVARLGASLGLRIEPVPPAPEGGDAKAPKKVVVVGFDDFARRIARVLCAAKVPYVAMTSDREAVAEGRSLGFQVEFGSPERPRALAMAAVGEARAVIVASPATDISRAIVTKLRAIDAELPIFAATHDLPFFEELQRGEVCDAVVKSEEALEALARSALRVMGVEDDRADAAIEAARGDEAERLVAALS